LTPKNDRSRASARGSPADFDAPREQRQEEPMQRLVIATKNKGKLRELRRLLEPLGLEVVSIGEVADSFHVDESGSTFAANAALKARAASELSGAPALGDDSGLEVDALGGRPGVRSARYAGEAASDAENNELLLRELAE